MILCLVILVLCQLATARKYGAPKEACVSMTPRHGSYVPQSGIPPFEVILPNNEYSYTANGVYTVMIKAKRGISNTFKGFMIQARRADYTANTREGIGSWSRVNNNDPYQSVECGFPYGNSMTHMMNDVDRSSVTLKWKAPPTQQGHLVFKVTIVTNYHTFWTDVTSDILRDPSAPDLPQQSRAPMNQILQIKTWNHCGKTKGCFMNPPNCVQSDCDYLVTYRESDDKHFIDFEMSAKTDGYVALGLSHDQLMGDDSVIQCAYVRNLNRVVISNSYNIVGGKRNQAIPHPMNQDSLSDLQGYWNNGQLSCRFRRRKESASGNHQIFDLDKSYYMFVARGPVSDDGNLLKHDTTPGRFPLISPDKQDLTGKAIKAPAAAQRHGLVKAHGCMMIVAWILFVSFAMLMAHYYKPMWPNESLYKERIWFQVHRSCMITALILTILAFILILIHARGYSQLSGLPYAAHPVLGFIIVILVIINPLITLCRCAPKDEDRPIFNWIHWAIGTVAHILAVINIFIGMDIQAASVLWFCSWILVFWVIFHAVVSIILEIHGCCMRRRNKEKLKEYEFEKAKMVQTYPYRQLEPAGRGFKTFMLAVYGVITACSVLAMVLIIAMFP